MKVLITYPTGFPSIHIVEQFRKSHIVFDKEIDYSVLLKTRNAIKEFKPDVVILSVPFAGGIKANIEQPVDLITKNLIIQYNVITECHKNNVEYLYFIGSSCMYPRNIEGEISETDIMKGELEPTNQAYAIAKLAGYQMCKAYNSQYKTKFSTIIPANLFGEYDDFNEETAHVIGALISRIHNAKINNQEQVTIWGSGKPIRDFIYAKDFANILYQIVEKKHFFDLLNVGSGKGYSILEIAKTIKEVCDYKGELIFDSSKPDGMKKKVLDISLLNYYTQNNIEIDLYSAILEIYISFKLHK